MISLTSRKFIFPIIIIIFTLGVITYIQVNNEKIIEVKANPEQGFNYN